MSSNTTASVAKAEKRDAERKKKSFTLVFLLLALVGLLGATYWLKIRNSNNQQIANLSGQVHYLGPDEYYLNLASYIRDDQGQTKLDSILLPHLPDSQPGLTSPTNAGFTGPKACAECHQEKHDSFVETSHAKTSAFASRSSILGSFEDGKNVLRTKSQHLSFEMLTDKAKFFQRMTLVSEGSEPVGADFPIDIVTGSGKVGQTYLYWQGEHLYQLHASYLKMTDSWMNSPGYEDGVANFARPILSFCLECHATYVQPYENTANQYHRENMVMGVTCEKCHGPGEQHIAFHRENPNEQKGKHITNPDDLPDERSLELCQLCHGGTPESQVRDSFTFRPGNVLAEHYKYKQQRGKEVSAGIHTNSQLPRLQRSKCFTESETMTCIDCHNPHQFERGDMRLFSDRCVTCHQPQACGKFEQLGERLRENCIDCHMRSFEVDDIKLISEGKQLIPTMRDHYIKVWPDATKAYLEKFDQKE